VYTRSLLAGAAMTPTIVYGAPIEAFTVLAVCLDMGQLVFLGAILACGLWLVMRGK